MTERPTREPTPNDYSTGSLSKRKQWCRRARSVLSTPRGEVIRRSADYLPHGADLDQRRVRQMAIRTATRAVDHVDNAIDEQRPRRHARMESQKSKRAATKSPEQDRRRRRSARGNRGMDPSPTPRPPRSHRGSACSPRGTGRLPPRSWTTRCGAGAACRCALERRDGLVTAGGDGPPRGRREALLLGDGDEHAHGVEAVHRIIPVSGMVPCQGRALPWPRNGHPGSASAGALTRTARSR